MEKKINHVYLLNCSGVLFKKVFMYADKSEFSGLSVSIGGYVSIIGPVLRSTYPVFVFDIFFFFY